MTYPTSFIGSPTRQSNDPNPIQPFRGRFSAHHAKMKNSIKNNKPLDGVWAPRMCSGSTELLQFMAEWIFPYENLR